MTQSSNPSLLVKRRAWSWLSVCGSVVQTRVVPRVIPWPTSPGPDVAPHTAAHSPPLHNFSSFHTHERYCCSPLREDKRNVVPLYLPASRGSSWHLDEKSSRTLLALGSLTFVSECSGAQRTAAVISVRELRWSPFGTGYPTRQRAPPLTDGELLLFLTGALPQHGNAGSHPAWWERSFKLTLTLGTTWHQHTAALRHAPCGLWGELEAEFLRAAVADLEGNVGKVICWATFVHIVKRWRQKWFSSCHRCVQLGSTHFS